MDNTGQVIKYYASPSADTPAISRIAAGMVNCGTITFMEMTAVALPPTEHPTPDPQQWVWHNSFAALGPAYSTRLSPTPLASPYWVATSATVSEELGLPSDWHRAPLSLAAVTGNAVWPGSQPLASVYSGHQFGQWAGQLGDGRAILLGEVEVPGGGTRELQLKGAGLTPYSRMGDGRAVLRSSIREFLCSEAMHGLGIPTTRALCMTGSDHPVRREEVETAAVVTRVAPSFIRFGHFEHFSNSGKTEQLKALADYVIDRFYPECRIDSRFDGNSYAALLEAVSERTARLLAQWQAVGFCHGVMNTDNMSILGLTIDYGPFQFLDAFNPAHICNHSDTQGRYAFNRQPNIAYWNLYCLGQALLPLIVEQELALAALESYKTVFPQALLERMSAKLGWTTAREGDRDLIDNLLRLLASERADYANFWRLLSDCVLRDHIEPLRDTLRDRAAFDTWWAAYRARPADGSAGAVGRRMLAVNPRFVLRNHLGEQAIRRAKLKDFSGITTLLALLERPCDEHPGLDAYAALPPEWAAGIEISCSS